MSKVPPQGRRGYHSPTRTAAARRTRGRVVRAATAVFLDRGYVGATLKDVARAADVSVDTIYKTFGSKITLLKEVLDVAIAADDQPIPLLERPGPQSVRHESDPGQQVRLLAEGVTAQLERLRPIDDVLRQAAAVDAEAGALRSDIQGRQRWSAMRTFADWIDAKGGLRDGLGAHDAGTTLWALTSPELHQMLRGPGALSRPEYCAWLEGVLRRELLGR